MAPLKPVKKDQNDKRVQIVFDCAKKTAEVLKSRNNVSHALEEEIETVVKGSLPLRPSSSLAKQLSTCDSLGCELWNAASNIRRDEDNAEKSRHNGSRLVVLLRVFAFLLIDTAHHATLRREKNQDQRIRNFKIALKACRACLDKRELELALKVLERCSDHVSSAENESPLVRISNTDNESDRNTALKILVAEFYLLRVTHSWKSERQELADYFFDRYTSAQSTVSPNLAEKAADLFYEAGKSFSRKSSPEIAIKWLERSLAALDACDLERLSQDAGELRLTITATLVDTLLANGNPDSTKRARQLIEQLRTSHGFGNRMAFYLLQVKLLLSEQPVDVERLSGAVSQLMRSAVLTEHNFKCIMQALHRVRKTDVEAACNALNELIIGCLLPNIVGEQKQESLFQDCIEKACVTFVMFATYDPSTTILTPITDSLHKTLDTIAQRSDNGLSPKATHATQTLIWKAAGAADPDVAQRWCDLLRHPLFDGAGQINKERIGRKVMTMAMERTNFSAAREAFFQMPKSSQNESITRYLAFKLGIRSNDYDLAAESLEEIVKHANNDQTFLYACVLEAQQSEMRRIAVVALQAILDKQPPHIHLPSLLRCTARLLISELDAKERGLDETMAELVQVFEHAAANSHVLKRGNDEQWRAEIQWWSKNAYNLSLKHCAEMHLEYLTRLLSVCTRFIEYYPDDTGPMYQDDVKRRKMLCHFLSSSALIVLSRNSEETEYKLQCYLHARQEIGVFRSLWQYCEDKDRSDMDRRMFELLKFDLECTLHLQQWDQLNAVLQACLHFEKVDRWDTLADIVLVIHQQAGPDGFEGNTQASITELLQRIINETWQKEKDIVKASRWLRLTFSMDLSDGDGVFALKLLKQAAGMAKKARDRDGEAFPETELQWLATTSFNKSLDLLSAGKSTEESEEWIIAALELARYAADEGSMHANLTGRHEQLKLRIAEHGM